jgi:hypothetical protein
MRVEQGKAHVLKKALRNFQNVSMLNDETQTKERYDK